MTDDLSVLFSFLIIGVAMAVLLAVALRVARAHQGSAPGASDANAGSYFFSPSDGNWTHIPADSGGSWDAGGGGSVDCGSAGADGGASAGSDGGGCN